MAIGLLVLLSGPKLWNYLPLELRLENSINSFGVFVMSINCDFCLNAAISELNYHYVIIIDGGPSLRTLVHKIHYKMQ